MSTIELPVSESLKEFVETQAAAGGYSSASDYVTALLEAVRKRRAWDGIEPQVLEGLASPCREMTRDDWQQLHLRIDQIEASRAK